VNIVHIGASEELLDHFFHLSVGDIFLRKKAPTPSEGFESAGASAEFFGEAGIFRETFTRLGVNEYGARQGQRLYPGEAIVGKQNFMINARSD
jgi:hypothetical protein